MADGAIRNTWYTTVESREQQQGTKGGTRGLTAPHAIPQTPKKIFLYYFFDLPSERTRHGKGRGNIEGKQSS